MYSWIHIYIHIYKYIYTYICIYLFVYVYICLCLYLHLYPYLYIYIYICVYIYVFMHKYIYIYIRIYTYIHAHTHTRTQAHTHTHTHPYPPWFSARTLLLLFLHACVRLKSWRVCSADCARCFISCHVDSMQKDSPQCAWLAAMRSAARCEARWSEWRSASQSWLAFVTRTQSVFRRRRKSVRMEEWLAFVTRIRDSHSWLAFVTRICDSHSWLAFVTRIESVFRRKSDSHPHLTEDRLNAMTDSMLPLPRALALEFDAILTQCKSDSMHDARTDSRTRHRCKRHSYSRTRIRCKTGAVEDWQRVE